MADGGWPAVNSDVATGLATLGLQFPAATDGVSKLSGATLTAGSNLVTLSGVTMTAADIGKRFTAMLGGSAVSFAGAAIVNPGAGYRADDTITVASTTAKIWSVKAVSATLVNGGSGGPASETFIMRGTSPGLRGARDGVKITVTTDATGIVTSVEVFRGGRYIDPLFAGLNEPLRSGEFPDLAGVIVNLTLGADTVRREAACFYGRISGATLTVEEMVFGVIEPLSTFAGIEVTPGTTITAFGTGTGGVGTYTLSTAHTGFENNVWLFVSETPTTTTTPAPGTLAATGGSGSGLTLTPKWRGIPISTTIAAVPGPSQIQMSVAATSNASSVGFCYGTDYGPQIQAALEAGERVLLPPGVTCSTVPLSGRTRSQLVGRGHALDANEAPSILAYVGAYQARGAQLVLDHDDEPVDGGVFGDFGLLGNNLVGIGLYMRGVQGCRLLPMSLRGHTYIGAQISGAANNNNANRENDYSTLIIREMDSPGWDVTGIYIGPGYPKDDVAIIDTCRSYYPYIHVDVDLEGFGRPIWYRNADTSHHSFVKTRGPGDLPGIEFAGHDTQTYFARGIHFSFLDPDNGGIRLRGGRYAAEIVVDCYNMVNGAIYPEVDDGEERVPDPDDEEIHVVQDVGARFFGTTNYGRLIAPQLQPFDFADLPRPRASKWFLVPVNNANTNIPGAEITGSGSHKVLAFTDANETLRVLAPSSATPIQATKISTSTLSVSNTTIVNIPGLEFSALTAGVAYKCAGTLTGTSDAAAGIRVRLAGGGALVCSAVRLSARVWNGTTVVAVGSAALLTDTLVSYTGVYTRIDIEGVLVVAAQGSLFAQAAQNVLNATPTTVVANSWLSMGTTG